MAVLTDRIEHAVEKMKPAGGGGHAASHAIHHALLSTKATRNVADFLHGTWLGHPLHPVLTDLTIGPWVAGSIMDMAGAITDDDSVRTSADHSVLVGTVMAVPTAVTGVVEFSTVPKKAISTATLHGMLNGVIFGCYVASVAARRSGHRKSGVLYSTIGLGLTLASSWLGGEMVYKHKVGVDHSDDFDGPQQWTPVMDADNLQPGKPHKAEVDGKPVMVYRDGEQVYAVGNTCAHAGGPLNEGDIHGSCVECPWHQSVFDMKTGKNVHGPATATQPVFEARIRNAKVELRLVPQK